MNDNILIALEALQMELSAVLELIFGICGGELDTRHMRAFKEARKTATAAIEAARTQVTEGE